MPKWSRLLKIGKLVRFSNGKTKVADHSKTGLKKVRK
jgi:hypothetical protein